MDTFTIQWIAFEWLHDSKGIKQDELYHGTSPGEPDFIYKGHYGYSAKILHGKYITFEEKQYRSLCDWEDGEVLVFKTGDSKPIKVIHFSRLPKDGGEYSGIKIRLIGANNGRAMIATSISEKVELERIRGEIETKILPQSDWADMLLQAMYAMLCDVGLIRFSYTKRMGIKHFIAPCPYCNTDNTIEGRNKLYWMVECLYCKRMFVAKRKI